MSVGAKQVYMWLVCGPGASKLESSECDDFKKSTLDCLTPVPKTQLHSSELIYSPFLHISIPITSQRRLLRPPDLAPLV